MTIGVGLVGYGLAAKVFHAPLVASVAGLALRSVVSSDAAKVHADLPGMRVVPDLAAMLADASIDLVVIATPDALHAEQAIVALDAGRHVVVDKPFALTLTDAQAVVDAGDRAGRMVSVFHNRRWDADFVTLRRLIGEGVLGEVMQVESHFDRFRPHVAERWREHAGAGVWNDLGPHLIDQALVLFGMPERVTADLAIQRAGGKAPDYAHVTLAYPQLRVVLHASMTMPAGALRFAVHGMLGSWVKHGLDPQEAALRAGALPGTPGWGIDPVAAELSLVGADGAVESRPIACDAGDYRAFYAGVAASIGGEGANPVPVAQALDVMRVLEAARRSASEGRSVAL
ncbi:oxidoreductase [Sphingomonas qomolangmaensis]|uniref:Oxidoreductase n=1 Tax=Sphingomonas qomolangmaensis TaxID=2918765 RepID=A0ABY5LBJ1_9SPHN|nr:oxidoreductase [Sphingomonas qomolangmaensis]UUL83099.1 oxidoreductase [Sphingomonas qomolangmaensis]